MWKHLARLWDYACVIAFGLWSLFTFWKILTKRGICYIEPRRWLAKLEFTTAGAIFLWGLVRAIWYAVKMFRED